MIGGKAWVSWLVVGLAALLLIVLARAQAGAGQSFDGLTPRSHRSEPPIYIYKSFAEAAGQRG
jgi:hypothetical protein